jgi:hypothetical protein
VFHSKRYFGVLKNNLVTHKVLTLGVAVQPRLYRSEKSTGIPGHVSRSGYTAIKKTAKCFGNQAVKRLLKA